jgi:hypothetical protein
MVTFVSKILNFIKQSRIAHFERFNILYLALKSFLVLIKHLHLLREGVYLHHCQNLIIQSQI